MILKSLLCTHLWKKNAKYDDDKQANCHFLGIHGFWVKMPILNSYFHNFSFDLVQPFYSVKTPYPIQLLYLCKLIIGLSEPSQKRLSGSLHLILFHTNPALLQFIHFIPFHLIRSRTDYEMK